MSNSPPLHPPQFPPPQIPPPSLPPSCVPPTPQNPPMAPLVWLIFGATGHLGRSITRIALSRGDLVTAVGRNIPSEAAAMHGWHINCQGLVCDVRAPETVSAVLDAALKHWGRVDVVVNATGYGIIGAVEAQDDGEVREQFETNVGGLVNIFKATLPYFRQRRRRELVSEGVGVGVGAGMGMGVWGRYIVFSSLHGLISAPGLAPYCATKWAIEGLTESLMYELDPLGLHVTLVEPGPSRRDEPDENVVAPSPMWGHFLMKSPPNPSHPSSSQLDEDYSHPTSPANHAMRMVDWLRFRQPTSAVKVSRLVWELAHCANPPLRLLVGSHAVEGVRDRLRCTIEEIEDWKHLNRSNWEVPSAPQPPLGNVEGGSSGGQLRRESAA